MKVIISLVLAAILTVTAVAVYLHTDHGRDHDIALHGAANHAANTDDKAPFTVSFAQNDDFYLCNDPFWLAVYDMMKEVYAIGIDEVTVELLTERTFAFMRAWPHFTPEQAEGWVDHVKDIPAQFVTIIREDPTVLDSCANFSVAAVGPP